LAVEVVLGEVAEPVEQGEGGGRELGEALDAAAAGAFGEFSADLLRFTREPLGDELDQIPRAEAIEDLGVVDLAVERAGEVGAGGDDEADGGARQAQ
jgi:hypothetical protein